MLHKLIDESRDKVRKFKRGSQNEERKRREMRRKGRKLNFCFFFFFFQFPSYHFPSFPFLSFPYVVSYLYILLQFSFCVTWSFLIYLFLNDRKK